MLRMADTLSTPPKKDLLSRQAQRSNIPAGSGLRLGTYISIMFPSNLAFVTYLQSLDNKTIQRLHSIQLFTQSRDQGFCDDEKAGTWTWFELAIMENADATVPRIKDDIQLSWTSHKNVLDCENFTWVCSTLTGCGVYQSCPYVISKPWHELI